VLCVCACWMSACYALCATAPLTLPPFPLPPSQLLTASFDGTIKIWAARDHRLLRSLVGHSGKVMAADFSPGEQRVASAGFDRTVKLWAVQ
jgi:WD40 repeat protein